MSDMAIYRQSCQQYMYHSLPKGRANKLVADKLVASRILDGSLKANYTNALFTRSERALPDALERLPGQTGQTAVECFPVGGGADHSRRTIDRGIRSCAHTVAFGSETVVAKSGFCLRMVSSPRCRDVGRHFCSE